ncbi:MAG TPA: hypothetical protein VGE97_06645 [Nitrososphaera sp.]|jgi:hypothetical protein
MSDLTLVNMEHDGTVINTFQPENLQFTLNKGEQGPHDISYEVSRSAILAENQVGPYRTDFKLIDDTSGDPVTIMAGMHTMVSVTSDEEHAKFAGKDWLHYLERRNWPYDDGDPNAFRLGIPVTTSDEPPPDFAYYVVGRDSATIIKDILDLVLDFTNSLDLTYTLPPIGHAVELFTIDLIDSENILSKIQTLSKEVPGEFDFWVEPDTKEFVMVAPRQYDIGVVDDDSLAEYIFDSSDPSGGMFTVSWTNTGPAETRLTGTGSNPSKSLVSVREYIPSSNVFRILERQENFGDVFSGGRLERLTRQQLLFDLNPVHEVTLSVVPESISDFWTIFKPGKAIWIRAELEVHTIDAAFEIVAIDGQSDSNGNMLASFRLNQIYTPAEFDT